LKKVDSPVVTIYIPNYNYADYLDKSIQSVLSQTFQGFELIIIDDGSTDSSREIIKRYENSEKTYIVFQQNKGLNRTNNIALKLARGKYILRLDADDYMDIHALEIMVNELERYPDSAMVFPDYYLIDEEENIIGQVRRHDFSNDVSLFDQPAHGACTLIRRDVLLSLGGYDEAFKCQDCYDLWLKIIPDYKVINVNLPLFYYRQHPKSLTKNEARILRTRAEIKAKHAGNYGFTPKVLAILPVRGRKIDPRSFPLAKLTNKRLIDWTLEAALESKYVTDVLVSTPNEDVQKYVRKNYQNKIIVLERPKEMARINMRLEPTLLEALKFYAKRHDPPDILAILFIEAPFRNSVYIDKAIDTFNIYDVDVVDAIREEDDIFYWHDGKGLQPWNVNSGLRLERENLYRRVGGIHLVRRNFLEKEKNMFGGKIGHIVLDQKASFTISTQIDWQVAKFLAKMEN
jgi:CMP-N-acetylneuraminic acid synthetase